ncbi:MAG: ATP-binding protein [Bradymonadia bacterium]
MTPGELDVYLDGLVQSGLDLSVMIWGPPGIGKSSIVAQVAKRREHDFVDVRLSQLAPTDLRGLPVPEDGEAKWFPPEFLPRSGKGILFLDEMNMAPPAVQGIAQQLVLDRKVGNYTVPEGWFIWAAGNRKEDRASVFDMPAPLANRFIHLSVGAELKSFQKYAASRNLHPQVVAFVAFRPNLLHNLDPQSPAWPSPRSWEMASRLHSHDLPVAPAVGAGAAAEFTAFLKIYSKLPDLSEILEGRGKSIKFPEEPSQRYAITVGLGMQAETAEHGMHCFKWMNAQGQAEWLQLLFMHMMPRMQAKGQVGKLAIATQNDPEFLAFFEKYMSLIG